MFRKRTESMSVSEFMNRQEAPKRKSSALKIATGASVPFMVAQPAFASEGGGVAKAVTRPDVGMDQLKQILEALVNKSYIVAEYILKFAAEISIPAIFIILPVAWLISLFGMKNFGRKVFQTSGLSFIALQLLPIAYGVVTGGEV